MCATTATKTTTVSNATPEATMTLELPEGTFASPVGFCLTHLDPATLPPENGTTSGGSAVSVDPVVAYQITFAVPTLGQDARLSFDVPVAGLDPGTQAAFLLALEAGRLTLATKGDAVGSTYQTFPLCTGSQVPTAGGCVLVQTLDAAGQPTTEPPAIVRFSNVVGHFSTWAVAIVTPSAPPASRCPRSQGFWKNNGQSWPVTSLTLGNQTYTKAEALALLQSPTSSDASLSLARQLIAANLNVAAGSDPKPVSAVIADADGLLRGFAGKLPYQVKPSSATGQRMIDDASVLDHYNNGTLTPACAP